MNAPPGFIESLTIGLLHRWKPEVPFVILTAYFDESLTRSPDLTLMAGFLSYSGQWRKFDKKFLKLLSDYGLTHFHAWHFKHTKGEFAGWSGDKKSEFTEKLHKVCLNNTASAFVAIVGDDVFKQHYKQSAAPPKVQLDSQYGLCFRMCLEMLLMKVESVFGTKDLDIHLVFESGHPNSGAVFKIFEEYREHRPSLKTVTAADKRDSLGIQAADFLAYYSCVNERKAQHLRIGVEAAPLVSGSWDSKKRAKIHRTPFVVHADADLLGQFRQKRIDIVEHRKAFGSNRIKSLDQPVSAA